MLGAIVTYEYLFLLSSLEKLDNALVSFISLTTLFGFNPLVLYLVFVNGLACLL
ncbi:hypothetical protein D3C76_1544490 [compost metagenome]